MVSLNIVHLQGHVLRQSIYDTVFECTNNPYGLPLSFHNPPSHQPMMPEAVVEKASGPCCVTDL